jgi:hypothetical protein
VTNLTVVTIVGFPHSGSTLLGDILGSADGVLHGGELAVLCRRAVRDPLTVCSCGAPLDRCTVWGAALGAVLPRHDTTIAEVADELDAVRAGRTTRRSLLIDAYRDLLVDAAERASASVVVDSSNWPWFGRLLADAIPDTRVLHLVRDPRAAVHSRLRTGRDRKLAGAGRVRQLASVARDGWRWGRWNDDADALARGRDRHALVHYEDLTGDVGAELARVTSSHGIPAPHVDGARVRRARDHVVWGNRRAVSGEVEVVADDAWRRQASAVERGVVGALTLRARQRHAR